MQVVCACRYTCIYISTNTSMNTIIKYLYINYNELEKVQKMQKSLVSEDIY